MDATSQKLLQHVMTQINNHPISRIFAHTLSNDSTIDLSIISTRIAQNSYANINDFLNDIEKICSSARLQFDKTQYYVASAEFLKKLVYKEIKKIKVIRSSRNWCNRTYEIREKLKKLIDSPPLMPNEYFSTGIDPSRPIESQLPTESTLKKLIELSSRALTQSDLSTIPKIINSFQPGISAKETMPIDVRKLSLPTINALMSYMEKKLRDRVAPSNENISIFSGI